MKNKKFAILLLVTILLLSLIGTGCGKKVTAQECAQVLWDMDIKHDTSNISKLKLKEQDGKDAIDKDMKNAKDKLRQGFTVNQIKFTDAQLDDVCNALSDAYGKANVKIEEVSNDDKTAQIKYTTTYIDIGQLAKKASDDALTSVKSSGITDKSQAVDKFSELYIQNLITQLKNPAISTDTKDKTYKFVKKDNVWLPEDATTFGESLGQLVTNQI